MFSEKSPKVEMTEGIYLSGSRRQDIGHGVLDGLRVVDHLGRDVHIGDGGWLNNGASLLDRHEVSHGLDKASISVFLQPAFNM